MRMDPRLLGMAFLPNDNECNESKHRRSLMHGRTKKRPVIPDAPMGNESNRAPLPCEGGAWPPPCGD